MWKLTAPALLLLTPLAAPAEVYRWVDEYGNVHYSDRKPEERSFEEVEIGPINSYESASFESDTRRPAARGPKVTMYATSWCGYCARARKYFRENNIPFTEYDIEKDPQAKRRYDRMGARGVPVILVGDRQMVGFSEAGFERLYR